MGSALRKLRVSYKENPGWHWLLAVVFLFPILPEYVSPFILFIGFIVFRRQWTREGKRAKIGTIGKFEMLFMGFALISTIWSSTKLESVAMAGLWWGMFLVQIMIYNLADTKKKIHRIFQAMVSSAAISGAVAAIQMITYFMYRYGIIEKSQRLINPIYKTLDKIVYTWLPFSIRTNTFPNRGSAFYSNPNLLATYLLICFPISIYLFLNAKTTRHKWIYLIINLLITGGISSTLSRTACVIVILGWLFMFIVLIYRHRKELIGFGITTVCITVPSILTRYHVIFHIEKKGSARKSTDAHLQIWNSVINYVTHHAQAFFIGLGFGCESTGTFLLAQYDLDKPHAHNFILEFWAELGIVGVILLTIVIIYAIIKILEINPVNNKSFDLTLSLLTGFILLLAFGMTDFIFNSPKQIILFTMMLGLIQAANRCYDTTPIKSPGECISALSRDTHQISAHHIKKNHKA